MKVAFSREVPFTPVFNDNAKLPEEEQLKFKLKPMNTLDLLDLTDVLKTAGFTEGEVTDLNSDQMKSIVKEAGKYVPKYSAMTGNDGFTMDEVIGFPAFLSLASEVLFQLLTISSPTKADTKNS